MKIDYRLDEKDVSQTLTFKARNLPSFRRFERGGYWFGGGLAGLGLVVFVGCGVLISDLETSVYWSAWGVCLFLTGLFSLVWTCLTTPVWVTLRAKSLLKKNPDLCGEFALELTGDGLTEYSEGRTLRLAWRRIEKLAVHKNFLYIFTDPLTSMVLPLRAFADQAQGDEFLNRLTSGSGRTLERSVRWGQR